MGEHGANLGGEQSGHMILSDYSTTGDGLVAALQVLGLMRRRGIKASEATRCFTPIPQVLRNVRFAGDNPLEAKSVKDCLAQTEEQLKGKGRLVVRTSGTEPLVRLMVEAEDEQLVSDALDALELVVLNP